MARERRDGARREIANDIDPSVKRQADQAAAQAAARNTFDLVGRSYLASVALLVRKGGMHETARRTKQRCGKVFRHAIGLGQQVRDITVDLRGLLEPPTVEHHAALTDPRQVGELLLDLDTYEGRFITRCALRLEPLVFLRSRELRHLEWAHVDFEATAESTGARAMEKRCRSMSITSNRTLGSREFFR
jgi:integrase